MMKMLAIKGNRTTTGGVVLAGDMSMLDDGQPLARHMDRASCGHCGKNGPIFGTAHGLGFGNARGVCDGDIVMCDCSSGTNRVIARSTTYFSE
ncbi:PAAR domain-containing protein [Paraburkholderia sp.]|uniref:PAAR domain-containing protein n=1 Tax=Paraburkholderia sp. TaxID=1926495 RepID=UPI00239EAACB|nr:PAAR domain-containing protein [Paraburkholderia sp.]MDE1180300.1 PAAR domain-containing protein [Paraburkholderia sp.]